MLKLKRLRQDDLLLVMKWRTMPEVTKYMYTDPKLTEQSQFEWFKKVSINDNNRYWVIEYENSKIGLINLYDIDYVNKRCFWAYYIADTSYRGKGIGRNLECNIYDYVFCKLQFNKLCCEVFEQNEKVIKIHEKMGSKIEGHFQKHILKNGVYYNVVRMAILHDEWDSIRKQHEYESIEIE